MLYARCWLACWLLQVLNLPPAPLSLPPSPSFICPRDQTASLCLQFQPQSSSAPSCHLPVCGHSVCWQISTGMFYVGSTEAELNENEIMMRFQSLSCYTSSLKFWCLCLAAQIQQSLAASAFLSASRELLRRPKELPIPCIWVSQMQ